MAHLITDMLGFFRNTVNYVMYNNGEIMNSEESTSILQNQLQKQQEADAKKELKVGIITMANDTFAIIDNKLHVDLKISKQGFGRGDSVTYYMTTENGEEKVTEIVQVNPCTVKTIPEQPTELVKVKARNNRTVVLCNDDEFCLDNVTSDFVPQERDWLQVTYDDERRVMTIKPKERKTEQYRVTDWDGSHGILNNTVSFERSAVQPGFEPEVNDIVIATVVECDNMLIKWRALNIIPAMSTSPQKPLSQCVVEHYYRAHNKNGMTVGTDLTISLTNIGQEVMLKISINNVTDSPRNLLKIEHEAYIIQLSAEPPCTGEIILPPRENTEIKFLCTARFMGRTRELLRFVFSDFEIERWVSINVVPPPSEKYCSRQYHSYLYRRFVEDVRNRYAKGLEAHAQRPVKAPSFVRRRVPEYQMPRHILEHYLERILLSSSLRDVTLTGVGLAATKLSMSSYMDRFHTLLFMEELAHVVCMNKYSVDKAIFKQRSNYLTLDVESLRERRPAVTIGDKVLARPCGKQVDTPLEGLIHRISGCTLFLKFQEWFHNEYDGGEYQVDFVASRCSFRRRHLAVERAFQLGEHVLFPDRLRLQAPQINVQLDETTLKEGSELRAQRLKEIQSDQTPTSESKLAKCVRMVHERKSPRNNIIVEATPLPDNTPTVYVDWVNKKLNFYQKCAVVNVLQGVARPMPYLIFGPPGTGKTITVVEAILQIFKMIPNSRILVTAPTNSATDLIVLRIIESGLVTKNDLVRLLAHRCVAEDTTPEWMKPFAACADMYQDDVRDSSGHIKNGVRIEVPLSEVEKFRIVVSTCMTSSALYSMGIKLRHFTHVVVDEASQCTEPETMIPITLSTNAQIILAGDPMQLGACVLCYLAKNEGLDKSYLKRMMEQFPYQRDMKGFGEWGGYDPRLITKLMYNYRSLPEMLHLCNSLFYNTELKPTLSPTNSAESEVLRKAEHLLPKREGKLPPALVFHGIRGDNFQTPDCPSWVNPCEAIQVVHYIRELYKSGFNRKEVGIISPYIKQCQEIRTLLQNDNMELPKIGTVEDFQGQEFKIILLSTVRSTDDDTDVDVRFGLGFLSSPQRVNVACSRAQALLIIVGNPYLLILDSYWRSVIKYAQKIDGYTGCWLPNTT